MNQPINVTLNIDKVHTALQMALDCRPGISIYHNILYISQLWEQVLCILCIDIFHNSHHILENNSDNRHSIFNT